MLGYIKRFSREFQDPLVLKTLYCSLVRPNVEYCSIVWSPSFKNHCDRIEAIQKNFVRFALRDMPWTPGSIIPSYRDRCRLLGLETLEHRRKTARQMFIYDLIEKNIKCTELSNKLNINVKQNYNLRTNPLLKQVETHRTVYGMNEPIYRSTQQFKEVEDIYVLSSSRDNFKKLLKSICDKNNEITSSK